MNTISISRNFFPSIKSKVLMLFAGLFLAAAQPVQADTQLFNLDQFFTLPSGSPPTIWSPVPVTVSFADLAGGGVRMRIKTTPAFGANDVESVLFNVNPALGSATLTFSSPLFSSVGATSIVKGSTGGGLVGVGLYFAPGFTSGMQSVYDVHGPAGFNVASFASLVGPPGKGTSGAFYVSSFAGIGWLSSGPPTVTVGAIPEPEVYAMLLAGLGIMGFVARRRKQMGS
jgi:PEP-CTERM motif